LIPLFRYQLYCFFFEFFWMLTSSLLAHGTPPELLIIHS